MLKVLIACAIIDLIVAMIFHVHERATAWIEGASILVAVVIVSGVTSISDYRKESQFIDLNKFNDSKNTITVKRGGEELVINIDDLKVGDVTQIKTGLSVPCDSLLLPGSTGVLTDEAAMTGESDECEKDTPENCEQKRKELLEDE
jgi:P-type Ca2+ transporter type 2C